jgi:hypothetical protein
LTGLSRKERNVLNEMSLLEHRSVKRFLTLDNKVTSKETFVRNMEEKHSVVKEVTRKRKMHNKDAATLMKQAREDHLSAVRARNAEERRNLRLNQEKEDRERIRTLKRRVMRVKEDHERALELEQKRLDDIAKIARERKSLDVREVEEEISSVEKAIEALREREKNHRILVQELKNLNAEHSLAILSIH